MAVADRWHKRVNGRKVKSAQWGRGRRWIVRWRDGDDVQRSRSFDSRDAAETFWASLRMAPAERTSSRTVAEQYELWWAAKQGLAHNTLRDYRVQWRMRVEPAWGLRTLTSVQHSEVAAWVGTIAATSSPSVARRAFVVLSQIIRSAVRDGILTADPTQGVPMPKPPRRPDRFLTVEQVRTLAAECAPHELVVWTLALTGLRWGELAALTVGDVDAKRRRIRVERSTSGQTKTGAHRDVPVPPWLLDRFDLDRPGDAPLLTTTYGGPWSQTSWKRIWRGRRGEDGQWVAGAVQRAGLPDVRVHDLRHAAASWAIASGADVKAVQRMLGHASATLTLDRYGHLFDSGLDDVARRMGEMVE